MIILDTNVVSELMLTHPSPTVIEWLDSLHPSQIWLTAVTVFEIRYGIERLDAGRKKDRLNDQFSHMLRRFFRDHILSFDTSSAMLTAKLSATARRSGWNTSQRDLAIAGIALQQNASLATRNGKDFCHEGLEVINPWQG